MSSPSFKVRIRGRAAYGERPSFVVDPATGCWICLGRRQQYGYAMLNSQPAHRLMYEAAFGVLARGLQLHHMCETKACIRPTHLIPVTRRDHRWLHTVLGVARKLLKKVS